MQSITPNKRKKLRFFQKKCLSIKSSRHFFDVLIYDRNYENYKKLIRRKPVSTNKPRLSDKLRNILRIKHYSYKTEKSYINWVYRFILFHKKRNPYEMGTKEVRTFLSYLAINRRVSA
jgi:hypothetical protein